MCDEYHYLIVTFGSYLIVEILFNCYIQYYTLPLLQKKTDRYDPLFGNPEDLFMESIQLIGQFTTYTFLDYLHGVFLGAKGTDVKKGNLDSFIVWMIYGHDEPDMDKIKSIRERVLDTFQFKMEEGFNTSLKHFQCDREPVKFMYRPLLLFLYFHSIEFYYRIFYYFEGYKKHKAKHFMYYRKEGDPTKSAIVVFHGISSGWYNYYKLLKTIGENRTVILINNNSVKINSIYCDYISPNEMKEDIDNILQKHNVHEICLVGQSWGTFNAGWIARFFPEKVKSMILIDPMNISFILPETTYLVTGKVPQSIQDYILYYFVRNDINVSYSINRRFIWYNESMLLSHVKHIPIIVCAGDCDAISSVSGIREIIKHSKGNHVLILEENIGHNDFMANDQALQKLKAKMVEMDF